MNKINNLTVVIVTYLTDKKILLNCIQSIDKKIKIIIVENSKKFKNKDYFLKKFSNLEIISCKAVGATKTHLSLFLQSQHGEKFSAIFFREAALLEHINEGEKISVLAVPEINEWQGKKKISLQVKDMRKT